MESLGQHEGNPAPVPAEGDKPDSATPKPPPKAAPTPTATVEFTGTEVFFLACATAGLGLAITGAITAFDWITGGSLKQAILLSPLKAGTYIFLTIVSLMAALEARRVIESEADSAVKRSYMLSIMVAVMAAYALFYSHLALAIQPPEHSILIGACAIVGAFIGWCLPGLARSEPYGTLTYLIILVVLVAFTWLARLESITAYGWAAFSTILSFFLRSSIQGLRTAKGSRNANPS